MILGRLVKRDWLIWFPCCMTMDDNNQISSLEDSIIHQYKSANSQAQFANISLKTGNFYAFFPHNLS